MVNLLQRTVAPNVLFQWSLDLDGLLNIIKIEFRGCRRASLSDDKFEPFLLPRLLVWIYLYFSLSDWYFQIDSIEL